MPDPEILAVLPAAPRELWGPAWLPSSPGSPGLPSRASFSPRLGAAPGKSGLHARGEGERVLALESRELESQRGGTGREGEALTQVACQVSREQFRGMDSAPGLCETLGCLWHLFECELTGSFTLQPF